MGVNSLIPDKNDSINKLQTKRLVKILKKITKNKGSYNIGICGMTYKNNTDIVQDSQGADLLNLINKNKIKYNKIYIYDEFIKENEIQNVKKNIYSIKNKKNFINKSDIIYLMYNVKNLNLTKYKSRNKKYIIDCWRLYKNLPKRLIKIDLGKFSNYI